MFALQLKLISELTSLLKTNKIDSVVMNEAPVSLNYEIIKANNHIFTRDKTEFEHITMSRYLDRRYYDKRESDIFWIKYLNAG